MDEKTQAILTQTVVLVDYDNVKLEKRERTSTDVIVNLTAIATAVTSVAASCVNEVEDVVLRLYGGWITERGFYSQRAEWILANLDVVRARFSGIRVLPDVVVSIAAGSDRLIGSVRANRSPAEQKMVDTMIAVDTLHFARAGGVVIIASDDDDMVPPVIAARGSRTARVILARRRGAGVALNDAACLACGVELLLLPPEYAS